MAHDLLDLPCDLLLTVFPVFALLGRLILHGGDQIHAAALAENLFQHPDDLVTFFPGNNAVRDVQRQLPILGKFPFCLGKQIILHPAVIFELRQDTVIIHIHQRPGRILLRQPEFFNDLNGHAHPRKQLLPDGLLCLVDLGLLDEPLTVHINAQNVPVAGGRHPLHLCLCKQILDIFT